MIVCAWVQGAVEARNRDYANIVRSLNFVSKGWYDTQVLADEDAEIRRKVSLRSRLPSSQLSQPCSVKSGVQVLTLFM